MIQESHQSMWSGTGTMWLPTRWKKTNRNNWLLLMFLLGKWYVPWLMRGELDFQLAACSSPLFSPPSPTNLTCNLYKSANKLLQKENILPVSINDSWKFPTGPCMWEETNVVQCAAWSVIYTFCILERAQWANTAKKIMGAYMVVLSSPVLLRVSEN